MNANNQALNVRDLDRQHLHHLMEEYTCHRSPDVRERLAEAYRRLAVISARRVLRDFRIHAELGIHDLENAGMVGLLEAIDTFEPGHGARFETFCLIKIRGAILDELRSFETFSRLQRGQCRKAVPRVGPDGIPADGATPASHSSDEEETESGARSAHSFSSPEGRQTPWRGLVSLNRPRSPADNDGGKEMGWNDWLEDHREGDPFRKICRDEIRKVVTGQCSEVERLVLVLYYYEELSLKQIGNVLGVSESRVSQIHRKLLKKLKARLRPRQEELFAFAR
ncbi:MAG: sigma-70 family RNA polymerase sigma factor [Planctomycetes bacterium]|nr:sigma-70 family RNA polymerase sigma factor [Planctomycetota bacterium]